MTVPPSTSEDHIASAIKEHLGTAVENVTVIRKSRISVVARAEAVREVATWLQTFGFDHTQARAAPTGNQPEG